MIVAQTTTSVYAWSPVQSVGSCVAWIVKPKVPTAVGVPEISPVVGFSVSPAGRAPERIEKE